MLYIVLIVSFFGINSGTLVQNNINSSGSQLELVHNIEEIVHTTNSDMDKIVERMTRLDEQLQDTKSGLEDMVSTVG